MVSVFLLVYGAATAIGSFGGGRFADANASLSLIIGAIGVTGSLVALLVFGSSPWLVAVAVLGIGLFGMGTVRRSSTASSASPAPARRSRRRSRHPP